MNAAFGSVSAGGLGTPALDVTQSGGGPSAFVASQAGGKVGGATLSKFSLCVTRPQHGGHRSRLWICASVGAIVTPAEISNTNKMDFRNRADVSACFSPFIIAAEVRTSFYKNSRKKSILFRVRWPESFPSSDGGKKRVRSSPVILVVR